MSVLSPFRKLAWRLMRALAKPRPLPATPRRILVTRRGKLGDVLMTTPLLEALHTAYPEAKLAFLVKADAAPALANHPYLAELFVEKPGLLAHRRLKRAIKRFAPDYVLMCEANPFARAVALAAKAPVRASLEGGDSVLLDTHVMPWGKPRHYAEVFLDLARFAGLALETPSELREQYHPSEAAQNTAVALLTRKTPAKGFCALAPGSGKTKPADYPGQNYQFTWPVDRYIEIAQALLAKGYGLVLLGAPAERPEIETVRRALPREAPVIDQPTSWDEAGALLMHCRVLLSTDGGLCHLASAVGTPVVALFGPWSTLPGRPLGREHVLLVSPAECVPCICTPWWRKPPQPHCDCLEQIPVSRVLEALESVLGGENQ